MEVIKNLSDTELLQAIRQGSTLDAAVKFIYREHFDSLSRFVLYNSGNKQDAEDIFQEVVVSFIELVQLGKFRGESSVKTFLFAINRNTWLNELKKSGRSEKREQKFENDKETPEMDISNLMVDREAKSAMLRIVNSLGESCKKILLLFYYENYSMREILVKTDFQNEQLVRNKKYTCLKQLEQRLLSNPHLAQNLKNLFHG